MKHILGVSAGYHDAAIAIVSEQGDIEFAGHSERYSGLKNDATLHPELIAEAYGYNVDHIAY